MGKNKYVKLKNKKKIFCSNYKKIFSVNSTGFSLIEVVIAIAIIGIITVPISTIFIGSISETVDSKEQLKANQLAQMYIERLKSMDEEEIKVFFDGTTEKKISGSNTDGLPVVPDGFTVELKYKTDTYDNEFLDDNILEAPQDLSKRDFKITIDSERSGHIPLNINGTDIYFGRSSEIVFDIIYDMGESKVIFRNHNDGNIFHTISFSNSLEHFFIIDCVGTDDPPVDVKIYIYNETNTKVCVYIFKNELSTIEPEIALDDGDGEVSVIYNQQRNESGAERRIYEIEALVSKDGKKLAKYKASKVTQ